MRQGLYITLAVLELKLRDPSVSASRVLGLKLAKRAQTSTCLSPELSDIHIFLHSTFAGIISGRSLPSKLGFPTRARFSSRIPPETRGLYRNVYMLFLRMPAQQQPG